MAAVPWAEPPSGPGGAVPLADSEVSETAEKALGWKCTGDDGEPSHNQKVHYINMCIIVYLICI